MWTVYVINYDEKGLEFMVYILIYPCLRPNEWYLFTEVLIIRVHFELRSPTKKLASK